VSVKTGITDGSHTEIVEGPLEQGDQVIVDVAGGGNSGSSSPGGRAPSGGPSGGFRRIL
jgi:multidrug efflux pump subunit AcrA (membrane-fusion protein)